MRENYLIHHNHTFYSIKDAVMSPTKLVEKAVEMKASAVSLTDHGVMTGVYEFMDACKAKKKEGIEINGIVGVEAYIRDNFISDKVFEEKVIDDENVVEEMPEQEVLDLKTRKHLILLAKNNEGYRAICKAVSASYSNMDGEFPIMNENILNEYFGKGSIGHGNVIATSACVSGVLSAVMLHNENIDKKIEKLNKKLVKCSDPNASEYVNLVKEISELQEKISKIRDEKNEAVKDSKKSTTKLESLVEKFEEGSAEYLEAINNLAVTKTKIENAKTKVNALMSEIAHFSEILKEKQKIAKEMSKTHSRFEAVLKEISEFEAEKMNDEDLDRMVECEALRYCELFGKENFYIELQYHGLESETFVFPRLANLANKLDIKTVLGNDAHYAEKTDILARQIVRSTRFNKWEEQRIGDDQLYIKTNDELEDTLLAILSPAQIEKGFKGQKEIADSCKLDIPFKEHYPVFHSESETSGERLRRLCYENIPVKYPDSWDKEKEERLEYELSVIDKMGYNDYHCIVQEYIQEGKNFGKQCEEGVGYYVGPGRGSGAGSIVNYLIGITAVDPIKYNLIFERYLNPERISMPDIDVDFANSARPHMIEFMQKTYGEKAVCAVSTETRATPKAGIQMAARVHPSHPNVSEMCSRITDIKWKFDTVINEKTLYDTLYDEFTDKTQREVLLYAKLIENCVVNYGTHAAAIVVSDTPDISDRVPLMRSKKGILCAQTNKETTESKAGLLKFDFLGLKNLDILTNAIRRIKTNYGIVLDLDNLPLDDKNVYSNIFANGNTDAVFQFESAGMKKMLKQFKPSSFEDLILLIAVFRPGPMQYLPDIIDAKHGRKKIQYLFPELESVLGETYGRTVYQEQLMQICNKFCEFSMGEADAIRKAMSKKKTEIFYQKRMCPDGIERSYMDRFIEGIMKHDVSRENAEKFWHELENFGMYAFNKCSTRSTFK